MNPAIFREYDIRGIADTDFDRDFAFTLGRAYGTYALGQGKKRVAVGRDCRLTSDKYAAALRQGLCATGLDVLDIGVCPTSLMYFSLHLSAVRQPAVWPPGARDFCGSGCGQLHRWAGGAAHLSFLGLSGDRAVL